MQSPEVSSASLFEPANRVIRVPKVACGTRQRRLIKPPQVPSGEALDPPDSRDVGLSTFERWVGLLRDRKLILDMGSGELGGFPFQTNGRVVRLDIQARFLPDVVADVQRLPFKDSAFDAILAMSILEHVPRPWDAVREMHRALQPGGFVLGYVPFMYPYHADSSFHDYYRFSDEAIIELFNRFSSVGTIRGGGYTIAMLRFLAGFTASQRHLLRFRKPISAFLSGLSKATGISDSTRVRGLQRTTTGYNFLARK